ncbi:MAG: TM2 domain-containing protein [Balneolaceae bacterium]|nr:TM2 domain-containing protein [Balneolaceae bacterium]MCH8548357.1 TM2 domain-containing protein [Balneolaceae bacterium]
MRIFEYLPELEGDELRYVNKLTEEFDENRLTTFVRSYRARRKEPNVFLLTALLGLVGIAGIHRFLAGQIAMGVLYFFTIGLCYVGTIIDLVNHKNIAFENNRNVARDIYDELKMHSR